MLQLCSSMGCQITRVVHGTYLSVPFPSHSNLCLSHPMGRFPWDFHRNPIPMEKPADNLWENTSSTVEKSLVTLLSKIFKKPRYQSDCKCQLPPKSQILKRKAKKPNNYYLWPQLPLKKAKFFKFGVKKDNLATLCKIPCPCTYGLQRSSAFLLLRSVVRKSDIFILDLILTWGLRWSFCCVILCMWQGSGQVVLQNIWW